MKIQPTRLMQWDGMAKLLAAAKSHLRMNEIVNKMHRAVQLLNNQKFLIYTPLRYSTSIPQHCSSRLNRHLLH